MKIPSTILFLIILITINGCEDKKIDSKPILVENTTEIFTQKDKKKQQMSTQQAHTEAGTFTLSSRKNKVQTLTLSTNKLTLSNLQVPTVLFNICSDTVASCLSQVTSLSKLQKKYANKLLIISIWVQNKKTQTAIPTLDKANYFISLDKKNNLFVSALLKSLNIDKDTALPLHIIYTEGSYYSHFEGPSPIEMLQHDIQQAIQH